MKNKNILLLRGLIREKRHWGSLDQKLKQMLPDYHIELLEIPGNGEFYKLNSFKTIRQNVIFLRDQWKKRVDYPSENIIVALSLGGMIAMEWATLFPEDWNKMILINSSHGSLSPFYKRMQLNNVLSFISYILSTSVKKKQEIIYNLTVNNPEFKKKTVEEWIHIGNTAPVRFQNVLRQLWSALNYRKISPTLNVKTEIICSKTDRLVSYECSEQIAKHWNCPIHYHETAGHDPSVEAQDWLCDKIKQIIKKND